MLRSSEHLWRLLDLGIACEGGRVLALVENDEAILRARNALLIDDPWTFLSLRR